MRPWLWKSSCQHATIARNSASADRYEALGLMASRRYPASLLRQVLWMR